MADTTDVDMLSAYHDMVEDNVADIVSISIGLCEKLYAPAYMPSGHKGDGYKVLVPVHGRETPICAYAAMGTWSS